MEDMVTTVWLLKGVTGSTPGYLTHADGVVRLDLEERDDSLTKKFEVPIAEVGDVNWPRTQFSGGCNFVVGGQKYRLSFLQPQNTRLPKVGAITGVASISGGRKAGKAWKALLAA